MPHLMKDSNSSYSFVELREKFNIYHLFYCGIKSALKAVRTAFKDNLQDQDTFYVSPLNKFLRCKKPSKFAHKTILSFKQVFLIKSQ